LTRGRGENYLDRLAAREALGGLKRRIVFGLVVSLAVLGVSAAQYFLVLGAADRLWMTLMCAATASLAGTLAVPWIWALPERLFRRLANVIGHAIFAAILTVVYFTFFWPIGTIMRCARRSNPICRWDTALPSGDEAWRPKHLTVLAEARAALGARRRHLLLQPVAVLGFFVRRGHYLLVPVLILLIVLGLVLFFLQTSALAPFIYTIF